MTATIHDVAREAGVSIATVSRAINNNYPVKDETREKIERAIEKLQYVPNEVARNLILKNTSNIGVIVPGITNLFFSTIVEEINKILVENSYTISLYNTDGKHHLEESIIKSIKSRSMDGLIVIDPTTKSLEKKIFKRLSKEIPTVLIHGHVEEADYNLISYDESIGTLEAFNYLYELGHKKIDFLRGEESLSYDLKEDLYKKFIKDKNLDYKNIIKVSMSNSLDAIEKTEEEFDKFLKRKDRGTAVFACNDLMALGVLNACKRLDIQVPEELSIIGFDNTLISTISHPKLTTVDLSMKNVAVTAGEELLKLIKKEGKKIDRKVFASELLIRDSVAEII